jgi:hypothetical protein
MPDDPPISSSPDASRDPDGPTGTGVSLPPLRPPGAPATSAQSQGTVAAPDRPAGSLPPIRDPEAQKETPPEQPPPAPSQEERSKHTGLWTALWILTGAAAITAIVVVAMALGRDEAQPVPDPQPEPGAHDLSISFPDGTSVYAITRQVSGYVQAEKSRAAFLINQSQAQAWSGTQDGDRATVTFDTSTWGDRNGVQIQEATSLDLPVTVADDGRILGGGSIPVPTFLSFQANLPGTDLFLPAMPGRDVFVGEVWERNYTRPYDDVGTGSIRYETTNKLDKMVMRGGRRLAQVITIGTMDVDVTLDVRKYADVSPGSIDPSTLPPGTNPTIDFTGTIEYSITTLVDPQDHVVRSTEATAHPRIDVVESPLREQDPPVRATIHESLTVSTIRTVDPTPTPNASVTASASASVES